MPWRDLGHQPKRLKAGLRAPPRCLEHVCTASVCLGQLRLRPSKGVGRCGKKRAQRYYAVPRMEGAVDLERCRVWEWAWPGKREGKVARLGQGQQVGIIEEEGVAAGRLVSMSRHLLARCPSARECCFFLCRFVGAGCTLLSAIRLSRYSTPTRSETTIESSMILYLSSQNGICGMPVYDNRSEAGARLVSSVGRAYGC